jgi:hypothetical protein
MITKPSAETPAAATKKTNPHHSNTIYKPKPKSYPQHVDKPVDNHTPHTRNSPKKSKTNSKLPFPTVPEHVETANRTPVDKRNPHQSGLRVGASNDCINLSQRLTTSAYRNNLSTTHKKLQIHRIHNKTRNFPTSPATYPQKNKSKNPPTPYKHKIRQTHT